jgi:hypothetical protein
MGFFKKKSESLDKEANSLSGDIQWHDLLTSNGFPQYGTVSTLKNGLLIQEYSDKPYGRSLDRWFMGWGFISGSKITREEKRIEVLNSGFSFFVYPSDERGLEDWMSTLVHFRRVGGENILRRE